MNSGSNCVPSGLVSGKAPYVAKVLDQKRWSQAEARAAELLAQIQPNHTSEERRNAVVSYLRCLIMKSVPCQVFTFGSVPLKTYLPDGDIDITVFSDNEHLEDRMIQDVLCILEKENEEKNEDAEFHLKEVQYIRAEVKIIKCLVENFVVDISFNQIGGLGTLCFLEEVDNLMNHNHLFKQSIILVKAWCYYESRVLGSHHGLVSTYGLEVLVIYLFNVYSNTFSGPLEVFFRFLDFFSKFDWKKYCISLKGPVTIKSLPNMKAEPPRYARKNSPELLLTEKFLNACEFNYGVKLSSKEIKDKPFVCKYFNIVDPLRANNNLGRSITKGNFFRIRSAIALGANRIERLLACPEDRIIAEFDLIFKNTWERNGKGYWMDVLSYNLYIRNNNITAGPEYDIEQAQAYHGTHSIYQNPANHSEESKQMFETSDVFAASQTWSSENNGMFTGIEHTNTKNNALAHRSQSPIYSSNEVHDMHHFPGFYSSSEFSHLNSKAPTTHHPNTGFSSKIQQSFGQISDDGRNKYAFEPENTSSDYYYEYGSGVDDENVFPVSEAMVMQQEEFGFPNFSEYQQAPMNVNSSDVSFLPPPHVLASGYMHENSLGVLPKDVPFSKSFSGHNMPYPRDTTPFPSEWFPSRRSTFYKEELTDPSDYNVSVPHSDHHRQMAVNNGSSSGNSSWQTGATSYTPKDHGVTTNQKWVLREKGSGNPPDNRIIDKDVNSRASSSFRPPLPTTSRTNLTSSNFSTGSSWKTSRPGGVNGNLIRHSTIGTDLRESTSTESITSRVQALQLGRKLPMTVPNSSVPDYATVHVGPSGSSERAVDNKNILPVACGSSRPSFQAPTMFPFYNHPAETETTFAATNFDILEGDFATYYVNLQYGRFCKNQKSQEALPPSATLPTHLKAQFAWHRRPIGFLNILDNSRTPVRVLPPLRASPLHRNTNERGGFWLPRFSDGTGTYFPKTSSCYYQPRLFRKRRQQNRYIENQRYERKDNHDEREQNSSLNAEGRFTGRGQFYNKFANPGSNESSHRGESSHSGTSKVPNFGSRRDSKSSTQQPSSSNNPWGSETGTSGH